MALARPAPATAASFCTSIRRTKSGRLCLEAQLLAGSAGEIRSNGGSHVAGLTSATNDRSVPRRQPEFGEASRRMEQYDIICRSNTVTVRINGVLENEVTRSSVRSGAIGLQAEGKPVEFRNLVIEPLP